MEDALAPQTNSIKIDKTIAVLILVVMEDALALGILSTMKNSQWS